MSLIGGNYVKDKNVFSMEVSLSIKIEKKEFGPHMNDY